MANYNKIFHKYWYTEISGSYSDISQSQGTDDQVIGIAAIFIRLMMKEVLSYGTSPYNKTPYHMSALTGKMWVVEMLHGHLEQIWNELGAHKHVFLSLCSDWWWYWHQDSKYVTLEEQLAIFLYTCITGLSIWHVSKWFQHAMDTTSWQEPSQQQNFLFLFVCFLHHSDHGYNAM